MVDFSRAEFESALDRARLQQVKLRKRKQDAADAGIFWATSGTTVDGGLTYLVNVHQRICSCQAGRNGRFCKHLAAGVEAVRVAGEPRETPAPNYSRKRALARLAS